MKYVSTRGNSRPCNSAEAIKNGLAEDGGLYLPDEFPILTSDDLNSLCKIDYPHRAAKIMHKFLCDKYSYKELLSDCINAYSQENFSGGPAPITNLGDKIRVLELWHGPTAAFKDLALQIMPHLFVKAIHKTNDKRLAHILVATSGDTGKAALEGYRDVDGVKISVFYPVNGVSSVQKLQMATQEGNNVKVYSVKGNFDDAQNGVKKIFGDADINKELDSKGIFLSSANSINWGRLVPQIVYYISAYCDMVNSNDIKMFDEINVCVPTGNFGNILAAYIAKSMGLPIHSFICASNSNNVLTDFFETGTYNSKRPFYITSSPSMDILISSNLERLLYMVSGSETTSKYMKDLVNNGEYTVSDKVKHELDRFFDGGYCNEESTAAEIKHIYNDYGYLCDTHTAVGLYCAEKYLLKVDDKRKILSASTASPYKFAPKVFEALTGQICKNELEALDKLNKLTGVRIPAALSGLAERKIRFDPNNFIKPSDMSNEVLKG